MDPLTKRSKKYGFVRFSSIEESQRAIYEMNGKYILSRPIKLNVGFKKSSIGQQPQMPYGAGFSAYGQPPAPPSYPAYPSYPSDPYGMGGQGYGYNYGASNPYGHSNQYQYGSGGYQYPQSSYNSTYGMSIGGNEYPTSTSHGYQQSSGYPSYPESGPSQSHGYKSYGDNGSSMHNQSSSYQYNYGAQSQYNYGSQEPPAPVQEPPKEEREIEIDLDDIKKEPIFEQDEIMTLNKELFEEMLSQSGTIDLI